MEGPRSPHPHGWSGVHAFGFELRGRFRLAPTAPEAAAVRAFLGAQEPSGP